MLPSDMIREGGWCQFALDKGTKHCILGALLNSSACGQGGLTLWYLEIQTVLETDRFLTGWNNAPERTAEEVIAVLEETERRLGLRMKMEDLIEPFKEKEMAWRAPGSSR